MNRMNESLVKHLFIEPNPQPQRRDVLVYYLKLQNRMFPGQQNYIRFLSTQNIDEQYELAGTILHELCYFSNFPPAYNAFEDVLSIEKLRKKLLKKESYKYIARDHYIHIVNLYILGIYIFFYDETFYNSITSSNRYARIDRQYGNSKLSCIKDFLSEWKYFCLYHDLGYVLEALSNEDMQHRLSSILKELEGNYTFARSFAFENTLIQHSSFGAIEIMSKLLVSKMVLVCSAEKAETEEFNYLNRLLNYIKNRSFFMFDAKRKQTTPYRFQDIADNLKDYYHLEKIENNYTLKMLLPVVQPAHIAVVGSEKESGRILFISYPDIEGRQFILLDNIKNTDIQRLLEYPDMLLFDDYAPNSMDFDYFIKKAKDENDYFANILDLNYIDGYFDSIYEYISEKYYSKFLAAVNEQDLMELSFEIYHWIYARIQFEILGNSSQLQRFLQDENIIDNAKLNESIINYLKTRYDEPVREKCVELIRDSINKVKPAPSTLTSIDDIIATITEQFIKSIEDMTADTCFKDEMREKIELHYIDMLDFDLKLMLLYYYMYFRLKFILKQVPDSKRFDFNYDKFCENSVPEFYSEGTKTKTIQSFKSCLGDCDVTTAIIEDNYTIPYGNTQDHGIVSAKYASGVFEMYRHAVSFADKDIRSLQLLSVLLDITEYEKMNDSYIYNYNHIIQEVVFAIFVHNLYPSEFKDDKLKKYKTKLANPFVYFALLSDSLQQWNRPHSVLESVFQFLPNTDASSDYNVSIQNGYIYVFESGKETDQTRLSKNIKTLSEFLSDVNAVVKIGYTSSGGTLNI